MAMPNAARLWTREEVLTLPDDGKRYELIDGELLVSPSQRPVHQFAVQPLYSRLGEYVRTNRLGWVMVAPADLDFGRQYHVQPDLFVVPDRSPDRLDWSRCGVPIFIAEILSPSTSRGDRKIKRPAYQRAWVGEYWIVDVDARTIERWQPADLRPEVCLTTATWQPRADLVPFTLDLNDYFAAVWGEGPES